MIHIKIKDDCCGCGACEQICPKKCITWEADTEGFLYPHVDETVCIDCGLCERICPIKQGKNKQGSRPLAVFSAYVQDAAIRENSSSGGIFSALAENVLNQGGIVFGAAFAEDFSVHHIKIESADALNALRGSKYVQSRTEDTYTDAKLALEQGKLVLYSGVGCQIAGLNSFLRKEYDNLFTVDVLCHGVPSPEVWEYYLQCREKENGSKLANACFRNKRSGWHNYETTLCFRNGRTQNTVHNKDVYMNLFLSEICLRPSCYNCHFREGKSGADITLGDAWGIEKWMPHMDDDKGTSVVLINTEKGKKLWDTVCPRLCAQSADFETVVAHNMVYRKSVKPNPNRSRFFKALNQGASMDQLIQLTRKSMWRKAAGFAKRCVKKMLKILGLDSSSLKKYI